MLISQDEIAELAHELLYLGAASDSARARLLAHHLLHSGWRKTPVDPYEGFDLEETAPTIEHDLGY